MTENNTMRISEFLAIPRTSLPSAQFERDEQSWRADPWEVLRECARTGAPPEPECGTSILLWSEHWSGPRLAVAG